MDGRPPGRSPEVGVLMSSVNTTALPPGRYFAQRRSTQAGKPQGHIVRPFRVLPAASGGEAAADARRRRCRPSCSDRCCRRCRRSIARTCSSRTVLNAVLSAAEQARPAAKAALAVGTRRQARTGRARRARGRRSSRSRPSCAASISSRRGRTIAPCSSCSSRCRARRHFAPARLYLGAALAAKQSAS